MNNLAKTLVLHIGWHKTGTTTLQEFFNTNAAVLKNSAGIFYPRTGLRGPGHNGLAHSVDSTGPEHSPLWTAIADEISQETGWSTVLMSAEGFDKCEPDRAGRMLATLPSFDRVVVIVYLRQPDELLQSQFTQRVKSGRWTGTFAQFVEQEQQAGRPGYSQTMSRWKALLPDARLVVRPFEKRQWHGMNLLQDFFHSVGWPDLTKIQGIQAVDDFNRAPGAQMLALARRLNQDLRPYRKNDQHLGFARLQYELDQRGWRDEGDRQKLELFTPEQRKEWRIRYKSTFEELGIRFEEDIPQPGGEVRGDLPAFDELEVERRAGLLMLALKGAVLSIDSLQDAYWHHKQEIERLVRELKNSSSSFGFLQESAREVETKAQRLRVRHEDLEKKHQSLKRDYWHLKRAHRELERQFNKTLRSRLLRWRARWRSVRGCHRDPET